jgi:hypothetical protein
MNSGENDIHNALRLRNPTSGVFQRVGFLAEL